MHLALYVKRKISPNISPKFFKGTIFPVYFIVI